MPPLTALKAASIVVIVTGLVSAAAAHPATAGLWGFFFDAVRWPIDGAQGAPFSDEASLLNAIHGGVLAGWGAMLWGLTTGPIARGDGEARRTLFAGMTVWFLLDSAGSLASGWAMNVAVNIVFYTMFALPLWALGRSKAAA